MDAVLLLSLYMYISNSFDLQVNLFLSQSLLTNCINKGDYILR